MGRARAEIDVPVQISVAEALWYDTSRWAAFVDGFKAVAKLEGDWPDAGARLIWDSGPAGRGRVVERVTTYIVRSGQTVDVEDERITGTQTVTFTPRPEGCVMALELRYKLKTGGPLAPVLDAFFVRRQLTAALERTLGRFRREVRVEGEVF